MILLPFEAWCFKCLLAKSKEAPHTSIPASRHVRPRVQTDLHYYNQELQFIIKYNGSGERQETPWATTLGCVDCPSQNMIQVSLPTKAIEAHEKYMVKQCVEFVKRVAHLELEFSTDGEPTMMALADQVKKNLILDNVTVHCTTAPRYSSKSLGAVGAAQDMLQRQTRVLRLDAEERYQCGIGVEHESFSVAYSACRLDT